MSNNKETELTSDDRRVLEDAIAPTIHHSNADQTMTAVKDPLISNRWTPDDIRLLITTVDKHNGKLKPAFRELASVMQKSWQTISAKYYSLQKGKKVKKAPKAPKIKKAKVIKTKPKAKAKGKLVFNKWTDAENKELLKLVSLADKPADGINEFARRTKRSKGAVSYHYYKVLLGKETKPVKAVKAAPVKQQAQVVTSPVPTTHWGYNITFDKDSVFINFDSAESIVRVLGNRIEITKR